MTDPESLLQPDVHPFWRFSLTRYSRAGVPPLCLRAQDEFGADVNLVLFGLWLGSEGRVLTTEAAAVATLAVADWHRNVVVPMRGVRRWLKTCDSDDPAARDALRAAIQKHEIEAERLEQDMLYRVSLTLAPKGFTMSDPGVTAMLVNSAHFCKAGADAVLAELAALCV